MTATKFGWRYCTAFAGGLTLVTLGCGSSTNSASTTDAGADVAAPRHDAAHPTDAAKHADSAPTDARTKLDAQDAAPAREASAPDGHATEASATDASTGDAAPAPDAGPSCGGSTAWTLVWSDEFNGADGTGIDTTKWAAQTGGDGWGNQEREYYTADLANAEENSGNLVITATTAGAAANTCWYGQCEYTSARLQSLGLFAQQYGRFEARIQIPRGQGLWPAFWMLGSNINTVNWPTCGEIDVMENIGKEPGIVHGSMHGPGYSGGSALTALYTLPGGANFADDFHVFAVEWETGVVRFYVDDTLYETETPADIPAGDTWVFDQPFFILLNVAVGGSWPGDPDGTTVFPQTMLVDYVRVCQ
jgi:beta-glucanase (GH16 family)